MDGRLRSRLVLLGVLGVVHACVAEPPSESPGGGAPRTVAIEAAIEGGTAFLLAAQGDDGAWRSDVYGNFRQGDALSPLALRALLGVGGGSQTREAIRRSRDYLAAIAPSVASRDEGEDGDRPIREPVFPVYTAAQALEALAGSSVQSHRDAEGRWSTYLTARQLADALGWRTEDPYYGGWGYSAAVPHRPEPGEIAPPLVESNTSATLFALQGLEAAGALKRDPSLCARALIFLHRVQNYTPPETPAPEADVDDGGFFFIGDDPVRNKAGVAGDPGGKRFNSASTPMAPRRRMVRGASSFADRIERMRARRRR